MNTVKGSIVKAVAGREKNGFFVVLDCDSVFAYIADGKRRKVSFTVNWKISKESARRP
mgnify:CR=1 FL=1